MVTHDAAIALALNVLGDQSVKEDEKAMEAAIRAYLDARGLVVVPKEPTPKMQEAFEADYIEWFEENIKDPDHLYKVMIAAAPDPFGDAP